TSATRGSYSSPFLFAPFFFGLPPHGWCIRLLHLEPIGRAAYRIWLESMAQLNKVGQRRLQLHHQKPVWKPTPNQRIFLRWRKLLNAPTAGQHMKLGMTKPCPRITVWRTVKSAGNRWPRGTARTVGTTNSSRCQTARMFERGRALTSTIGGRQLSSRSNPHEASTGIRRRLRTPDLT